VLKVIHKAKENVEEINYYSPFPFWAAIVPALYKDYACSLSGIFPFPQLY